MLLTHGVFELAIHWVVIDDYGTEINIDNEYGSMTIDAAYDFFISDH